VPELSAGAVQRLLEVFDREHAARDGRAGFTPDRRQAADGRFADVVVVRGLAADYAAEPDHAVDGAFVQEFARHAGELERAGNTDDRDAIVGHTVAAEAFHRALFEALGHDAVETRDDDADAHARSIELANDLVHHE